MFGAILALLGVTVVTFSELSFSYTVFHLVSKSLVNEYLKLVVRREFLHLAAILLLITQFLY